MSMQDAFKSYWLNCFNWAGTAKRQEFWKNFVFWLVIYFILDGGILVAPSVNPGRLMIIRVLFAMALFPWFALIKRRLNDTGMDFSTSSRLVWALILLPFLSTYIAPLNVVNLILIVGTFIVCAFASGHFDR